MRIHSIRHQDFLHEYTLGRWAADRGHALTATNLYDGQAFPDQTSFDWLWIMGGTMDIYMENEHPWLIREKPYIAQAVHTGKLVLGVCLGGQLLADVLGGPMSRNPQPEYGWHDVALAPAASADPVFSRLPRQFPAFCSHGDAFAVPRGGVRMASSAGCVNQIFTYGGKAVGLQFHPEADHEYVETIIARCPETLDKGGPFIQSREAMRAVPERFVAYRGLVYAFLDSLVAVYGN